VISAGCTTGLVETTHKLTVLNSTETTVTQYTVTQKNDSRVETLTSPEESVLTKLRALPILAGAGDVQKLVASNGAVVWFVTLPKHKVEQGANVSTFYYALNRELRAALPDVQHKYVQGYRNYLPLFLQLNRDGVARNVAKKGWRYLKHGDMHIPLLAVGNIQTVSVLHKKSPAAASIQKVNVSLNDGVRDLVKKTFANAPKMVKIGECESNFRHYAKDGTVLKGKKNPKDTGVMQINRTANEQTARNMGLDVFKLEDNLKFALYLYKTQGTKPWNPSRTCWDGHHTT
jgi:hypothetical protein